jgi:hypothetical protein
MNDDIVQGEVVETIEEPEAQILNLFKVKAEELADAGVDPEPEVPPFNPVLKVWREVLAPARDEAKKRPTPQWCSRITASYREIDFKDMLAYRDAYYGKIEELYQTLLAEIELDDECLNYTTPEEDVTNNSGHYKFLLTQWQMQLLQWELDWSCADLNAPVELAAISEIHKLFFGDKGIIPFLDSIQFQFTEEEQQELANELQALKEANGE